MRLADFIAANVDAIVAHWEDFAATQLPAATHMTPLELQDHAQQILAAIVLDLRTRQTVAQQAAKSKGLGPEPFPARETAAQAHAVLRARSGFDIRQLAAEYRALRASVLALWIHTETPGPDDIEDVIRFNEAIDQALAESIGHFTDQVDHARNLLVGMLSHDMRSPLQAIQMTAVYLARLNVGDAVSAAAQRLIDSGRRVQALLDDLTDFHRTNLGVGIPIERDDVDVGTLCAEELARLRDVYPGRRFELGMDGDCRGHWDGRRLQQLVCNLVVNAVKYGSADDAVSVGLVGNAAEVRIDVRNTGPAIPDSALAQIFEPLTRGANATQQPGLGLGLYIVREIARAHGGSVEVYSDDGATVFTTRLPKHEIPADGTAWPRNDATADRASMPRRRHQPATTQDRAAVDD